MDYESDLNHRQWLETVPDSLRQFVPCCIASWDASADVYNKWTALGWDERHALLQAQALATKTEEITCATLGHNFS